jgi:hypothetical protein
MRQVLWVKAVRLIGHAHYLPWEAPFLLAAMHLG